MLGRLQVQGAREHRIGLVRSQLDHHVDQLVEAVLLDGQHFELRHGVGVLGHLAQRAHVRVERAPGVVERPRRDLADSREKTSCSLGTVCAAPRALRARGSALSHCARALVHRLQDLGRGLAVLLVVEQLSSCCTRALVLGHDA